MSNYIRHPYNLLGSESPFPLMSAKFSLLMMTGMVLSFHKLTNLVFVMSITSMWLIMFFWWKAVSREGAMKGLHSKALNNKLRWGMFLFIISEIFFFISFFWTFFFSSVNPSMEMGIMWPPLGIKVFNAFSIPLLNTLILLSSGVSVTWAHHALMNNNYKQTSKGLKLTIMLGIYFTILQLFEYSESSFNISDGFYGSSFFIATGFHGFHVLVGTIFLIVCYFRMNNFFYFSSKSHFGLEAAAWYWHFVDVVWLFLFISIYWWGSI